MLMMRRFLWFVLLTFATFQIRAAAQGSTARIFSVQDPGTGSVAVDGLWQFHTSDSPATGGKLDWAQPEFDDSHWDQIRGDDTWGAQTQPGHTGYAWYRKQLEIHGVAGKSTGVMIPPVDDAYEIFWNGKKIGKYGELPPHPYWWAFGHDAVYALPSDGRGEIKGVLALRVWKSALSSIDSNTLGGLNAAPLIGDREVLAAKAIAPIRRHEQRALPALLISAIIWMSGVFSLLLFLRERHETLYLWLSIYLLSAGFIGFNNLSVIRYGLNLGWFQLPQQLLGAGQDVPLWIVLLSLFGLWKDAAWRRWTVRLIGVYLVSQVVDIVTLFFWGHAGSGLVWTDAVTTAVYTLMPVYIFVIVWVGLFRRRGELLPLALSVAMLGLWNFVSGLSVQGIRFTHWTLNDHLAKVALTLGGYRFGIRFVLDVILFVVLIVTVARHQWRERARRAKIDLEVKSAREVQQVLVPETVPAVPGYAIESVYKPAAEVGGDFFQVMTQEDGSTLVAMGDVSGKGLKAAMTVSLIVGTLRTLADYTGSPAEMIRGLNRRLRGRVQDGFATCVIVRIEANGDAMVANAGHFAPLRDGVELPVSGSLPLGIVDEAVYDEVAFRLETGETLVLYTDGIVEARNAAGELYGFERVQDLVRRRRSAAEIVEAACAFGQDDDITVLSIGRLEAHEPASAATMNFKAQIALA